MTTIAWDGEILASDSRSTSGITIVSESEKKVVKSETGELWRVLGNRVIAFACSGNASMPLELKSYLEVGLNFNTQMRESLSFSAIVICENQGWEIYKSEGSKDIDIQPLSPKRAIGSGADFATAALAMGKSSIDAVEVAILCDVYSGGDIQSFTINYKG